MARQKSTRDHIRKLGKIGKSDYSSYYLTLPISLVREFGWQDGQRLSVKRSGRRRLTITALNDDQATKNNQK